MCVEDRDDGGQFPFLFGGTFIEGLGRTFHPQPQLPLFPFLFGGTFIEGVPKLMSFIFQPAFPFLFGGTFIEGWRRRRRVGWPLRYFPSFSEGLSLRELLDSFLSPRRDYFPSFSEGLSLRGS